MGTYNIEKLNKLLDSIHTSENVVYDINHLYLLRYVDEFAPITISKIQVEIEFKNSNPTEIVQNLLNAKLIKVNSKTSEIVTTDKGKKIINLQKFNLNYLKNETIKQTYILDDVVGVGSTSTTFKGKHARTGRLIAVKIFKPDIIASKHIENELAIAAKVYHNSIIRIIDFDYFEHEFHDKKLNLFFAVYDYIEGVTLDDFIEGKQVLNRDFYNSFISEVGGGLEDLEAKGISHNDLHGKNILITQIRDDIYSFKIIDFTGITSPIMLEYGSIRKDIENFRIHAINLLSYFVKKNPSLSLERFLGFKLYYIYKNIINGSYSNFKDLMDEYKKPYIVPTAEEEGFPFKISRLEEFEDKFNVIRSFEPDMVQFNKLKNFGNLIISGPRGCGKSTYLDILAFNPGIIKRLEKEENKFVRTKLYEDLNVNYQNIFGIHIQCRQGEFKIFSPNIIDFGGKTSLFIKHIFILKFIVRTLHLISEALEKKIFAEPSSLDDLIRHLKPKINQSIILIEGHDSKSYLEQISSIMENEETNCISLLNDEKKYPTLNKMLSEQDLIKFYRIIRKTILELNRARFYILMDDVTATNNISFEAQKILNGIVRSTNEVFCFKISTDKYFYELSDEWGKQLQETHDYDYLDLGMSSIAMHKKHKGQSEYLERIINTRLCIAGYPKDKGIADFLPSPEYTHLDMIYYLASKDEKTRNKAKYAGWKLIWRLPTGSIRKLLDLCLFIFNNADILDKKKFKEISPDIQDSAVRDFSNKQLIILRSTSGILSKKTTEKITGSDDTQMGVGEVLFGFARVFGQVSQNYLRHYPTSSIDKKRKYEMVAIERNDISPLSESANEIITHLVANGVFFDDSLTFARSQVGLSSKYLLNKIFCPAFETTFRSRYHHRLSKDKFESFLLHPSEYLFSGTRFLEEFYKGLNKNTEKSLLYDYSAYVEKIDGPKIQKTFFDYSK